MILNIIAAVSLLAAHPSIMSLDGNWQTALQDAMPAEYPSSCPVPGIASQSLPPLTDNLHHFATDVDYDCIWYRKNFDVSRPRGGAVLHLRAKYNAEVFLNGKRVGCSDACTYSHAEFDISDYLDFRGPNELVVKVGSWRTASFPSKENKNEWWRTSRCPGIWDSVWIDFYGSLRAPSLEVLPDVEAGKILCRVQVCNNSGRSRRVRGHLFFRDAQGRKVLRYRCRAEKLSAGERRTLAYEIADPGFKLWTPGRKGAPILYSADYLCRKRLLKTVRFGYRDVKISGTRVLINGVPTHFCSENVAFQRTLISWADAVMDPVWVRRFIRTMIHDYGFNHLRMHLGHAPSFWYDIADEEGLMLQDEWCFMHEKDPSGEKLEQTGTEFRLWVRENINHPSVIAWDMENEGDVSLTDLCTELKAYDPTRPWAEDDFDTQHRYEYSENIVPRPYCEPDAVRPTTVLESCRLWINPYGQLEPRENFKTSRTASSWGVFYYDTPRLERLQAAIHADQGTYFRSLKVLAWAPFAALSGTVNGHNFFRGNIRDSLVARENLKVLSALNSDVGGSLLTLQAREFYKDRISHAPGSSFTRPVVLWNDTGSDVDAKVKVALLDATGSELAAAEFRACVPAFDALTLKDAFKLNLPSEAGEYDVVVSLEYEGDSFECFPRRICCGLQPEDLSKPFPGAVCVLDHFLPGLSDTEKAGIIKAAAGNPIDGISRSADGLLKLRYTKYDPDLSKSFETTVDKSGKAVAVRSIRQRSSAGWLQHAF